MDILSFCPYSKSAVLSVYRDPSPCPYTVTGRYRQSVYRDPSVCCFKFLSQINCHPKVTKRRMYIEEKLTNVDFFDKSHF